jgi:hypothetical protein
MNLYPYNALALHKRADHLWTHGSFIAICRRQFPHAQYFMLNDFFVELQFDPGRTTMIGLIAFDRGDRYNRMVEAIELGQLFPEQQG